jgi:hypothetical protein
MNQGSPTPERPANRAPVFFWITVGLLTMLLIGGVAAALLLVGQASNINRSGGWGWLLVGAIYVAATTVVCFLCAVFASVSLFRCEPHRGLSIGILIISCLVVFTFAPTLIGAANRLRRQHEVAKDSWQPPATTIPRAIIPLAADQSSDAPIVRQAENQQILELKSKLWEAIRAKNADAFVDCYCIEERFNTREIRTENCNQAEILLRGETVDVEIRKIPKKEIVEIMKIQNARPGSALRYSLTPKMMVWVRQKAVNGTVGRGFLIGEQDGKWYLITLAGHTT